MSLGHMLSCAVLRNDLTNKCHAIRATLQYGRVTDRHISNSLFSVVSVFIAFVLIAVFAHTAAATPLLEPSFKPAYQTPSYNGILVDDFEDVSDWSGCSLETVNVKVGAGACRWNNHTSKTNAIQDFTPLFDASTGDNFQFWAYSHVANGAEISLIIDSDADTTDYYYYEIIVDWTGWRFFNIPQDTFDPRGTPAGWDFVGRIRFNTTGWGNSPLPDTDLIFDEMRFTPALIESIRGVPSLQSGTATWTYTSTLQNNTGADRDFALSLLPEPGYPLTATLAQPTVSISDTETALISITVELPPWFVASPDGFVPQLVDLNVSADGLLLDSSTIETIKPLPQHPRLFVDPTVVATLSSRYNHPDLSFVQGQLLTQAAATNDGVSPTERPDLTIRRSIEANAFLYLANDDTAAGQLAVQMTLDYLSSLNNLHQNLEESRALYDGIIAAAMVYDWCYDLLTPSQRDKLVSDIKKVANLAAYGWPITGKTTYITGHFGEDAPVALLAAAIATFDEDQEIFTAIYKQFTEGLVPSRNLYYPMGKHHQGAYYGQRRFIHELHSALLFNYIGLDGIYDPGQGQVPYNMLYARTPSGKYLTDGDIVQSDFVDPRNQFIVAQLYDDSVIMDEAIRTANGGDHWTLDDAARAFIYWDPTIATSSINSLETARYFPSPSGSMIARTGWDMDGEGSSSGVAMALMNIGEYFFNNHSHLDSGHFGLYYKGTLALDSGVYQGPNGGYSSQHVRDYSQRTIAHNTLLIEDPNEPLIEHYGTLVGTRDGGQYRPNNGREWDNAQDMFDSGKHAEVLAHEIHSGTSTPDFTYLKGDITAGYNAPPEFNYPAKAEEIKRSFVFLDLKNSIHPAALIVFDRVVSTDPSFTKKWLLHSVEQPVINGSQISIERTDGTYNGRMVNDVLLPEIENQNIQAIGGPGQEFWVDGTNPYNTPYDSSIEPGEWRIELSPATSVITDTFLNVMHVMDADGGPQPLTATRIEASYMVGAQIADRAVFFSKDASLIDHAITISVTTALPLVKVLVTDLAAGQWQIQTADGLLTETIAADGHTIYFTAAPGLYQLAPGHLPTIGITSPADQTSFDITEPVNFSGIASDVEDGALSANIVWSSSISGTIGNGSAFTISDLPAGSHIISASVTDSSGATAVESITITVGQVELGVATPLTPTGTITSADPTFEWTPVVDATSYALNVSTVPTGTGIYSQTHSAIVTSCDSGATDCALQPAGLTLVDGEYTWQIQALNPTNSGPWSPTQTFTVSLSIPPLGIAILLTPTGTITNAAPTFTWTSVTDAASYALNVSTVPTGTQIYSQTHSAIITSCDSGATNCALQPEGLILVDGEYSWQIQALSPINSGPWSPTQTFTVALPIPHLGVATLLTPTGTVTNADPFFEWTPVADAESYALNVSTVPTGTAIYSQTHFATATGCDGGPNGCSIQPLDLTLVDGKYTWQIQALSPTNSGPWSPTQTFTVALPIPPLGVATLLTPTGTITNADPTFEWTSVADAESYALNVSTVPTGTAVYSQTHSAAATSCDGGATDCALQPAGLTFIDGEYTWQIQALSSTNGGPWSPTQTFTVTLPIPPLGVATLLTPTGTITDADPTFEWTPVTDATSYALSVSTIPTGTQIYSQTHSAIMTSCDGGATDCALQPVGLTLVDGSYSWQVQALSSTNSGPWSPTQTFTVALPIPPLGVATLITPTGTITNADPTFEWTSVTDATSYALNVSTVPTGTEIYSQTLSVTATGCDGGVNDCALQPAGHSFADGEYTWQIQALNPTKSGPWSPTQTFTVALPIPPLGVATLLTPTGTITNADPTFEWTSVTDATSYALNVSTVPTGTEIYSQTHSAIITLCDGGATDCALQPAGLTLVDGEYSWQVQALSPTSNGLWSPTQTFTVTLPIPPLDIAALLAPTDTITKADPFFEWTPVADAESYALNVSTVPTGTAIYSQTHFATATGCDGGVTDCALQPEGLTLVDGEYTWQIQSLNPTNSGPWSPTQTFTVSLSVSLPPLATPQLIGPHGNGFDESPRFEWSAVQGGTEYTLVIYDDANEQIVWVENYTNGDSGCGSGTGICIVEPTGLSLAVGQYRWLVRASDGTSFSQWATYP